jgi:phage shock protein E
MQKYRRATQLIYALMMIAAIWLIAPVMAGGGDRDAARKAWPMIEGGALLIDVRSKEDWDNGHLDGAIRIDWDQTDALAKAIGDDRDRPVVLYCRTGNRVNKAIAELEKRGYSNIFNATGLEALNDTRPSDN